MFETTSYYRNDLKTKVAKSAIITIALFSFNISLAQEQGVNPSIPPSSDPEIVEPVNLFSPEISSEITPETIVDTATEVTDLAEADPLDTPVSQELTKEQQRQIDELDILLKNGSITQEEYDSQKALILSGKLDDASALRTVETIDPTAQTLGKYIVPLVSSADGSLTYEYPIVLPTGRNNLTPDLKLIYNSSNKSPSSIISTGWSFNIPYIQRVNKKGTGQLYSQNDFISSLDGELINQGSGIYKPRTENGSFLKYQFNNNVWTITDKIGTKYVFGTTTQSRQDDPNNSTKIFSWMLEKVTDTNGNTITYTYFKNQGQIYPESIKYNQENTFEVKFNRVTKSIATSVYSSGFLIKSAYAIKNIDVLTSNSTSSSYILTYTNNLLEKIKLVGYESGIESVLPETKFEYSSSGNGWSTTTYMQLLDSMGLAGTKFIDVNGDGLNDYLQAYNQNGSVYTNTYLNNGSSFVYTYDYLVPSTFWFGGTGSGATPSGTLADINGDGLPDLISKPSSNISKVYLNNGVNGWSTTTYMQLLDSMGLAGTMFIDVNGDGLNDYIQAYNQNGSGGASVTYLNNGSSFVYTYDYLVPSTFWFGGTGSGATPSGTLADINGDGLPDLISKPSSNISKVYLNNGGQQFNITAITSQENSVTRVKYSQAAVQSTSNKVPSVLQIVDSITTDDKNGNVATTTYKYLNGDYYFASPLDRRLAGFGEVTKTNPDGSKVTTKYHQANGQTGNEPVDSYAKIGKPYEEIITDSGNNLFLRKRFNYIDTNIGTTSTSSLLTSQLTQQYDGTGSHTDIASTYSYDTYGNSTSVTNFGVVNGSADGSFADTGSDKRLLESVYTNDTSNYIVGLPVSKVLKNNSGTQEAVTNYLYDIKGNQLEAGRWISGVNFATTTNIYSSLGLVTNEIDPLNSTTTYSYDTNNLYPATVTNALNQNTHYTYDYSSGKTKTVTDQNGKVIEYLYDGLDRLTEEKRTQGNGSTETVRSRSYNTTATPQYLSELRFQTSTTSRESRSYFDGFGREIQKKSQFDGGWATTDTVYDSLGRVKKISVPYSTANNSKTNTTSNSNLLTINTYDPLNRITATTDARGTTNMQYSGLLTTVTDALSKVKKYTNDAFDNLVQVQELNGTSTYTTAYTYNTQNLLTNITDAENNTRTITYDGLGRRTKLEDLHTTSDSAFGSWLFTYNAQNLLTATDPKLVTTTYTYDVLNRVLTENITSTPSVDIVYVYDTCTNGVGFVCTVGTDSATTTYGYYKQGVESTKSVQLGATTYTLSSTYNRQNQPLTVTYPNSAVVSYGYNTEGLPISVSRDGVLVASSTYGVHGRPTNIGQSNGVTSSLTYDSSRLYELTRKLTQLGTSTKLQDLNYVYDNAGNISSITDNSNTNTAKTQTFSYDDLYRLTSVTATSTANNQNYTQTYTYSPIGNITSFNGVTMSYVDTGFTNPHAITNVGGGTYTYDENGNLTNDGLWAHSWDYRNRLVGSTKGTTTVSYTYNHDNERVKLIEGLDTTLYPLESYEIKNGVPKLYLSLGDSTVATLEGTSTTFVLTDHLGGTTLTTNASGTITQTLDYYPYGATRIDTGVTRETDQYTGYKKDYSTNLNYAGTRYYAGERGRFISQDPVALALGNAEKSQNEHGVSQAALLRDPQLFNAYGYARNNPLKYNDPTGEIPALIPLAILAFTGAYYGDDDIQSSVNSGVNQTLAAASGHDNMTQYNQSVAHMSNSSPTWDAAISNPELAGLAVGLTSGAAAAPAAAGVINVATIQSGVSLGYIGKMVVGAAAYEYVAANALRSTPDAVNAITGLEARQPATWGPAVMTTGGLYGLKLLGDTGEAVGEISNSTVQMSKDVGIKRKENKKHDI